MDKHKEKLKKLSNIQNKYEIKIKEYFKSNIDFEDYVIDVKFNLDHNLNEYFIINFGKYLKLFLECEKIPFLRLCDIKFPHWWDLKNTSNILSKLNEDIYIDLIKLAEQYYNESQEILNEYK